MATEKIADFNPHAEMFSAAEVVGRMKEALAVEADADLAAALRTSKQNVSKWKSRNSVPYSEAVVVALKTGVSLDYLLTGLDTTRRSPILNPSNLDPAFLKPILANLMSAGLLSIPKGRVADVTLDAVATSIALQYDRAENIMSQLVEKAFKPLDARNAAATAIALLGTEVVKGTPARSRKAPQ